MYNISAISDNLINNTNENKLIKKAICGDKDAFICLFKKYEVYLYKIAFMYVKDEDKDLEILQETIIKGVFNIYKLKRQIILKHG
ncbi:hypothetical protein ACQPUY_07515 [Clostridium nigeriense]|uniref:hypothetical protein n=1 Tax=Clostridium nigeriense TaxID=1805470 RepID=UPI003D34C7DE